MDRLTTLSTSAEKTQPRERTEEHDVSRIGRTTTNHLASKAKGLLLAVTTAAVALFGPGVATASAAVVPQYTTTVNCGYIIQQAALNSPYYWKISRTNFPAVTGTSSSPQRVWLNVQFVHQNQVYRQGWFYTDAVAGRWNTTWTSLMNQTSGWTSVQDANGESGYIGGEFTSLDTFILLSLQWQTGNTVTYQASEWAYAPNSSQNHNVCNAGADMH